MFNLIDKLHLKKSEVKNYCSYYTIILVSVLTYDSFSQVRIVRNMDFLEQKTISTDAQVEHYCFPPLIAPRRSV
jgi:hypothetical protein